MPELVVPYDPTWPERFEDEAERIREALGSTVIEIEHIGSTAVPGIVAKPTIDIAVAQFQQTATAARLKRLSRRSALPAVAHAEADDRATGRGLVVHPDEERHAPGRTG